MDTQSPYTFNALPGGNVEVLQNGQRISTGTASAAATYGYDPLSQAKALNPDTTAPAIQTTTPTTLSGDKSSQIIENGQKVAELSTTQPKTQELTGGIQYYSDGTPISAPSDAIIQRDENGNTWWTAAGKNYAIGPDQGLSPEEQQRKNLLEQIKNQTDQAFAGQISAIQAQYDSLIKQQKDVNLRQEASTAQTLLMGGTSRYAGVNEAGLMQSQISYGIQQIADLQNKQNMAIAQIKSAQAEKNYEFVSKELQRLDDIKKEKQKIASDLNAKLLEANKTLRQQIETRNNAIDNDIRTAILDAQKGGASPEQLARMNEALKNHDYGAAVAAGGDSLQSASGMVGEYNFYVRDAKARGQVPVDFNTYQNMDANRKAKVAAAGAQIAAGTDMTVKQQAVFNTIISNQIKSPSMTAVNRTGQLADTANRIKQNPKNAPDQVALIYGVIQILDSYQSAVREGEINLVRDTQGLLQKADNFYDRVSKGTPIDDSVALAYAKLAEQMIESIKANAQKVNNQFKAQAVVNGIGKQYDEYTTTVNDLNKTTPKDDLIQSEEQKAQTIENNLTKIKTTNPKLFTAASKMYTSVNPTTGSPYTSDEILQAFPELAQ